MIQPSPYTPADDSQLRFIDREGDTAWFNVYPVDPGRAASGSTVVVTMPYDDDEAPGGTRYRQIELSNTDRLALVAHLFPEYVALANHIATT